MHDLRPFTRVLDTRLFHLLHTLFTFSNIQISFQRRERHITVSGRERDGSHRKVHRSSPSPPVPSTGVGERHGVEMDRERERVRRRWRSPTRVSLPSNRSWFLAMTVAVVIDRQRLRRCGCSMAVIDSCDNGILTWFNSLFVVWRMVIGLWYTSTSTTTVLLLPCLV
ncbi:hypothetical protein L1987_18198 [Smallanthus sonchifolius]|uniref:Uncharacterized protein n=1 Tax=Smallanthus sonchifolius TaxID=185202 RepID=A0ACB9IZ31_9ASTR|nr:hypothetical protein L1987_18198 [Smallanthus sonchifolius]